MAAAGPTSNISALIRRSDARKHDSMTTVSAGCCQRYKQQHGCPVIFALFSVSAFQQTHFQGNVKDFWTTDCQNWVAHTIYILAPKPAGFFPSLFLGIRALGKGTYHCGVGGCIHWWMSKEKLPHQKASLVHDRKASYTARHDLLS